MVARISRKIAVFCVLLFVFIGAAVVDNAQATDLHDAAAQLTKKLNDDPDVGKIIGEHIVIAPFENINGKGDAVPRILQEMLTTAFIKAKHFKVLERDQLQSALDELHFQLSDLADPAKAKKIGKLAGATYVLLGSVSDTGSSTSINARIVSIESGESVAAEDVDIKAGDAASDVGGLNPASNPLTTSTEIIPPTTAPKLQTPAIDLNAKATSTSAGEYIGQKNNFGLLGGTKFQIAWRESLGQQPVNSFSAGDLLGDGTRRLVIYSQIPTGLSCVRVLKWENGDFKQTWESKHVGNYDLSYLRTSVDLRKPAMISLSTSDYDPGVSPGINFAYGHGNQVSVWMWDGTTFAPQNTQQFTSRIIEWLPTRSLTYLGIDGYPDVKINDLVDGTSKVVMSTLYNSAVTVADLDGDGKLEVAKVEPSHTTSDGWPIEVYSLTGLRKAVTIEGYGLCLTTWNPTAFKYPFLVAKKFNSGCIYFLQWNGESYERVWKSNQMDDQIIDMQVCDPKGEGKTGLVVLSTDKKGYYLTKIVHVN